jgi:cytochrome c oxidase subunit 2
MSDVNTQTAPGTPPAADQEPNHLLRAITIWVVLSVIGIVIVIATAQFVLPVMATGIGASDNLTFEVLTILAVPVALWVFVFLAYSLIFFRVRERPTEDAPVMKPYPNLQIGFLGITGALCLFLVIWGLFGFYQESVASAANPLIVKVTAQQWFWSFDYTNYGISIKGQTIELPVNRAVEFDVTSEDVLHGFALQAFGMRIDANPGEVTVLPAVTPTQIGNYTVRCVELCGLYHSYMWESVKVVSTQDFNAWIISQGGNP